MAKLTKEILDDLLTYDPETGFFTWNKSRSGVDLNRKAGSKTLRGYIAIKINGKIHQAHRLAHLTMTGEFPKGVVDHIDQVPYNNCWDNLRDTTQRVNALNTKRNTSLGDGVSFDKRLGCYRARYYANGKNNSRSFSVEKYGADEALKLAQEARREMEVKCG